MKRCKTPLLLLLLLVGVNAETLLSEPPVEGGGHAGLEPSRASIYRHLLTEQENVKGAGEHIKNVFDGLVANVHELIESDVLPNLQLQVDDVVDHAEETWVNAGNAMRTAEVRTCIENSEADAQQVAKRAVEKMRACADSLQHEGDRRGREATRLLSQIDAMTKRFIGALETCVKDAEAAGEWTDPSTEASTPDPEPTTSPSTGVEESEEDVATTSTCSKMSSGDSSCSCPQCTKEKEGGSQPKVKCRRGGRCEKGKNRDQNTKGKNENVDPEHENVDSNISKSKKDKKGKKKDGKQVEAGAENEEENIGSSSTKSKKNQKQKEKKEDNQMEGGETENGEENVEPNISKKEGKEKHGKKKETKGKKEKSKESYETKGRKSRKLLGFEEEPVESTEADPTEENSNDAKPKWRTEGTNPEEQFVIKCMQSPLLKELIDEKTRVYEKLEWMLNRVQEKEQGAQTLCIDEQLNKAQLKISAIKTRMASCAERYMRDEL